MPWHLHAAASLLRLLRFFIFLPPTCFKILSCSKSLLWHLLCHSPKHHKPFFTQLVFCFVFCSDSHNRVPSQHFCSENRLSSERAGWNQLLLKILTHSQPLLPIKTFDTDSAFWGKTKQKGCFYFFTSQHISSSTIPNGSSWFKSSILSLEDALMITSSPLISRLVWWAGMCP